MEMVGAEALAALFGVYGDVVRIKMLPQQESALIQMDKPVQVSNHIRRRQYPVPFCSLDLATRNLLDETPPLSSTSWAGSPEERAL